MKINSHLLKEGQTLPYDGNDAFAPMLADLVIAFGSRTSIGGTDLYASLHVQYPKAQILLCSTAGEIFGSNVFDDSVAVTAIAFDKTRLKSVSVNIKDYECSFEAGRELINKLDTDDLAYVLVLSDGSNVNGSELVRGMEEANTHHVPITGGLAGDAGRFERTYVGLNGPATEGNIAAVGFYGKNLMVTHGSMGGWEMFGPERSVSRAHANKLYEIDGKNALEIYKMYLGKYADELPGSALLFPLSVKLPGQEEPVVRTILSIDTTDNSMVFAGDVPEGSLVRFMKANFDKLIDAATQAAQMTVTKPFSLSPRLALLISCVGRKIILDNRIEEEVDAIADTFGESTFLTGFYSYGEISPLARNKPCELHNQTMTITTLDES
jgi:hypothetical protein